MSLQRWPKMGKTNEQVVIFIMDKTLEQIFVDKLCIHCDDGAPSPHRIYALLQQFCLGGDVGRFLAAYILFVPQVARKHGLV